MSAALLSFAFLTALGAPPPTHPIVPEDHFTLDSVNGLSVDRTGARVVFVRARWDKAADREIESLWLIDTRRLSTTRLTFGERDAWGPAFSDDGQWVYHLAEAENGSVQVHRLPVDGGASQQLTQAPEGVSDYQLGRDGGLWYVASRSEPRTDAFVDLRNSHDAVRYADAEHDRGQVRRVDLASWRDELIFEPGAHIIELEVSPDGRHLALLTAPDEELLHHEGGSAVVLYDRTAERITRLDDTLWRARAPSPYGWLLGLDWSDDSRALAFRVDYDGYPGETFVTELADGEPLTWQVPRPPELTALGGNLAWVPGQRELCQTVAERARVRLHCTSGLKAGTAGRSRTLPEGNVVVSHFAFSADGRDIVAAVGTPEAFPELYRLPARGKLLPVQLTDLNPHTEDWILPKVELVRWTSADGTEVEGILETPAGWTPASGPIPLVLQIHGGPTAHTPFMRRFRIFGQTAFAARGWALLSPNYRGSIGYGDAFLTSLIGHENDVDVADLLSGVDAMVQRGLADPERLVVTGWSNGGYLTNCLIARTPHFRAAISGAGVFDQAMQWALEDTPGHVINYMTGLPWHQPEATVAASPLYQAGAIRTPTLIHFGEFDERVPLAHGLALHRALSVYNDVPTELVIYPDAGHGLRSWTHQATKMAWDHAWIEHWLSQPRQELVAEP
jgi:dipeptidyl aminopeptidase/acylaminoacyl peptidase